MTIKCNRGRKLLMVRTPPVSRHPAHEAVERLFEGFNYTAVTQETLAVGRSKTKKMDVPRVQASFPPYSDERGLYGQVRDSEGHVYASLLKIGYASASANNNEENNG